MRGKYDPVKRFTATRNTNWCYSQKRSEKKGEEEERGEKKSAIRPMRVNSMIKNE